MNLLEQIHQTAQYSVGEAKALPFGSYHDIEAFEAEKRKLFSRDWVFICFEADIPNPGDFHAVRIADEPVMVIRGKDGQLRAMSNVCRHRGALLLKGIGNTKRVVCPYHSWTYSDQGDLKSVPYSREIKVNKQAHCLLQFKLESWFGLVFVSLNSEAPPLTERYKGLETYYSLFQVDTYSYTSGIETQHWQANWKLAMENFIEGYHFFTVHANTVEQAAPTKDCYYIEGHADWSITGGKQYDYPMTLRDKINRKPKETEFLSICMPPNFVCNLYEGFMTWARVLPVGPSVTEVVTGFVSAHPYKATKSERKFNDELFNEDKEICERVQEGVTSRLSKGGKLIEIERALVDFHQYLAKFLFDKDYSSHFCTEHSARFKKER